MNKMINADLAYSSLVRNILLNGTHKRTRTGVDTISSFSENYKVDLSQGYPLLTTKKVNFNSMLREVLWYFSGDDHIRNLRKHTKIWDAWADEDGNLDTAYGRYWRKFPSAQINKETGLYEVVEFDQIAHVTELIRKNPDSRRMVVTAWEPGNASNSKLPPCHYTFAFNVQDNKLNCHLTQRSGDVALGIPFNLACYALITQIIAKETNLELGIFSHTIIDAHAYCGVGERGEFYKENYDVIKQKLEEVKSRADNLLIKEWIDQNAPKELKGDHIPGLLLQMFRTPLGSPTLEIAKKPLDELIFEDFTLKNYSYHEPIKFEVAV